MVSTPTPVCDFGWKAPDFDLPGVDGQRHTLASARGPNGLLVMFICNHCPTSRRWSTASCATLANWRRSASAASP